jgi:hypothetical protein
MMLFYDTNIAYRILCEFMKNILSIQEDFIYKEVINRLYLKVVKHVLLPFYKSDKI